MHNIKSGKRFFERFYILVGNELGIKMEAGGFLECVVEVVRSKDRNEALTIQGTELAFPEMVDDIFAGKAIFQIKLFQQAVEQ